MKKQPRRGPQYWPRWSLEQARRAGQLELFVQRSTKPRGREAEPASQQRKRKRRMGVFG